MFVSNVLSGTVTRIDLKIPNGGNPIVESETQIASGYLTRTDPAALVVGPTGLAYNPKNDTLYVASTGDNEIFAIPNAATRTSDAGTGRVVYQDNAHLRGPLGLVLAPNGDLITANGDAVNADPTQPSELVEFTPRGKFVGQFSIDPIPGRGVRPGRDPTSAGSCAWPPSRTSPTASTCGPSTRIPGLRSRVTAARQAALPRRTRTSSRPSACRQALLRRAGSPRPSTNCSVSPRSRTFLRPCSPAGASCGVSHNPFQAFGLGGQKFVSLLFS